MVRADRYTKQTDKTVYASVLDWPKTDAPVVLGAVNYTAVSSVQMLGLKDGLKFSEGKGGSTDVQFPSGVNPESPIRWCYVLKIALK